MKLKTVIPTFMILILALAACAPTPANAPAASDDAMATEATAEPMAEEPAADEQMAEAMDIVDTAVAAGNFTTLVAAVEAAGLVDTLKGEGPFTVFAPTDEAFAALPEGTVEGLLADPEGALTDILLYHVISGNVMAADVVGMDGQEVTTMGGGTFTVMLDGDNVMLHDGAGNSVNVIATDIAASNGVIHVIDAVLLPAAGNAEAAAMEEEATAEPEEEAMPAMMDIVDTAVGAGNFTTLVAAVDAAGLVDTLKGEGPFTVFAPTDEAFAALPEGTVEGLLEDPEGALTDILLYHVVSGNVMAADVVGLDGQAVSTVGGGSFTVMLDGDNVMLQDGAGNMVNVVVTDIEASNGVIQDRKSVV